MKRLLPYGLILVMLCMLSTHSRAQVKLAEWNFNSVYSTTTSNDSTIYSPSSTLLSSDPNITISNSKFKILPDSSVSANTNYAFNAVTTYAQLKSGYNNFVSRLYFSGPSTVSDYSLAANHKNYYQFSLPTTGYDSIKVKFSFAGGQNLAADFLELIYSVDGGTSWADAGSYNAQSGWWLYTENTVAISARNKSNVLIRLVANTASGSGSANFNLDYFIVTGKSYSGGTKVNCATTISWPFNLGSAGQVATYTTGTSSYFSSDWVGLGANWLYKDKTTSNSITFTRFYPSVQDAAATAADSLGFCFRPKTGLRFLPSSVSFNCQRYGTDGGKIDVVWKSAAGKYTLASGVVPPRDNTTTSTLFSYDLSSLGIAAAAGQGELCLYMYTLGTGKSIGIANVVVNGTLDGTLAEVTTHSFATSVYPTGAGSIAALPVGTEMDEGTSITLTAKRNFGFQFKEWRDANADTLLSKNNPYTFTLNRNMAVKAVYDSITTYTFAYSTVGGPSYMVAVSPTGTVVNGQTKYETGTQVTLTASNNPVLTFTNWSTGETSATKTISMDQNQTISAAFSAADYIVGWDLYKSGGNSRLADFYASDENQTASLILRNADGTVGSWLDKSMLAASGYYGRGAAVNWKAISDKYYYQLSFSAKNYKDIKLMAGMLCNYNAYSIQKFEYSLDGTTFSTLGTDTLKTTQSWYDKTFSLPADANHAEKVYVRFIPDYNSSLLGSTSTSDGTSLSNVYVFATADKVDDGVAPVLVSSVPASASAGASTTGKIVLTFDEKVQISSGATASLGSTTLTPVVSGTTITFAYTGLNYNTQYSFTLAANLVSDVTGNTSTVPVNIVFTTMARPAVSKKAFDFVVGVDGDFKAAVAAATAASSTGQRYRIFFPNGSYNIGKNTGDGNQMTSFSLPNVSLIGQSEDNVILYNLPVNEGIGITATMQFTSATSNNYLQDLTLKNTYPYNSTTGRAVALWDQGNKNMYKNVKLLSYQDTYYSGGSIRSYFESSEIHGVVDFLCGGGDIFFNECTLYVEDRSGSVITAPATSTSWGYVFNNCSIDGATNDNGNYYLGRPWQNSPKSVFINTTMKILPAAIGWTTMGSVTPGVFAEYNSRTSSGSAVDLSARMSVYTFNAVSTAMTPTLTAAQAATYTVDNVLGGSDSWQPQLYTDQATTPVISGNGTTISWSDNNYVLCWAIFRDNVFVQFTTGTSYSIPSGATAGVYTVRAANEMGGLSPVSNSYQYTVSGLSDNSIRKTVKATEYFTPDGRKVFAVGGYKGVLVVRTTYTDGSAETAKVLKIKE